MATLLVSMALASWPIEVLAPLRIALGFAVVLLIPGYLLSALLFAQTSDVTPLERFVVMLGLSVASVTLIGLALNYSPWGIRPGSILFGMGSWCALLAVGVIVRRLFVPQHLQFSLSNQPRVFGQGGKLLVGIWIGVAAVVLLVSWLRPTAKLTEFYVLGEGQLLRNYPRDVQPGQTFVVNVGIRNTEGRDRTYAIKVNWEDRARAPVTIPNGGTWQRPLRLRAPAGSAGDELQLALFVDGQRQPYRTLKLSMRTGEQP
ncbi:DUF1616 domain-containing protein [Deinococcus yavapaiensis]|uniref:Uncharacterized protein DUF1616 n=1 Tax=Deinococcus yavapaiensis KR-236 TaxID=694435 RepID=A0A318SEL3_9DEIO|nr:DUF1616 domain-containing protein [Deinococcus yavapaiensis]PYE55665.1 uncharacterized protein DUF1616 [Deinococcus yavapaiensis KR-236]